MRFGQGEHRGGDGGDGGEEEEEEGGKKGGIRCEPKTALSVES